MRAAVCRSFGRPLVLEEIKLADPGPRDIRITIKACAICHSDVSFADGIWGGDLPAIYGHEGAGIVEAVGVDVVGFKPGDRVIATLIRHCSNCRQCGSGMEVLCEAAPALHDANPAQSKVGESLATPMQMGGFAEQVLVHESQVHKILDDIDFDVASLLACGVITGWGAVKHAGALKEGEHSMVIGCGGVGINTVQAARHSKAQSVIAVDTSSAKRELITGFGATHALDPLDDDFAEQVLTVTDGRGVDQIYVTVGVTSAIEQAFSLLSKGGKLVVVGMPASGAMAGFEPANLAAYGQTVIGTKMGNTKVRDDIAELQRLYEAGELELDRLISGRFTLDQVNEALDGVRRGEAIKNVIVFD